MAPAGGRAPDAKNLSDPQLHERLSVADLRWQIGDGSTNKRMPTFAGVLDDKKLDALVIHVRSLQR
jgi:hypothetical protein